LDQYQEKKEEVFQSGFELVKKFSPNFDGKLLFQDTFTPLTIEKFTSHINGTVYGSIDKTRDGKTPINNLYIIGTDQGFLGIVGSMLSGISMSNLHVLMNEGA
jgi:phytoene dehydrogenase-like protein